MQGWLVGFNKTREGKKREKKKEMIEKKGQLLSPSRFIGKEEGNIPGASPTGVPPGLKRASKEYEYPAVGVRGTREEAISVFLCFLPARHAKRASIKPRTHLRCCWQSPRWRHRR